MLKEHLEFFPLDLSTGWEVPKGYPSGLQQKILSGFLDEERRRGTRTRLLRFDPGAFTTEPFIHEYWEEVFQLSGTLTIEKMRLDESGFPQPTGELTELTADTVVLALGQEAELSLANC